MKRNRVGNAGTIHVRRSLTGLLCQATDLVSRSVDERHLDAQAAQKGDIQEDILDVFVFHDRAIDGDHEDFLAKARHIAQNLAQIRQTQHPILQCTAWSLSERPLSTVLGGEGLGVKGLSEPSVV